MPRKKSSTITERNSAPKPIDRTLKLGKSVLFEDRWLLRTLLEYPAEALAFARGRHNSIWQEGAWRLANQVFPSRESRALDKAREMSGVRNLLGRSNRRQEDGIDGT
jgi:hypothetical protein